MTKPQDEKPPKFFIPEVEPAKHEETYRAICRFISAPVPALRDRICAISWIRFDVRQVAVVGEAMSGFGGETVFAIVHDGKRFCICTPNHGVLAGYPLYVEADEEAAVMRFSA